MHKTYCQMPSNIALIKYMGKKDAKRKIPTNISLSLTLPKIVTKIIIESADEDAWQPFDLSTSPQTLSNEAQNRFFQHAHFVQKSIGVSEQKLLIQSGNNFPASSGIASSASSFAALTLAVCKHHQKALSTNDIAQLSRQGSGSSCRSFFSPFSCWDDTGARQISIKQNLAAAVVIVSNTEKNISSSKAHSLVTKLDFFEKRIKSTHRRYEQLITALNDNKWEVCYEIVNNEWQEMHQMFADCTPAFTYLTDHSQLIIQIVKQFWQKHKTGPLITFDAGPNCHLIFNDPKQQLILDEIKKIAPVIITRDFDDQ